MAARPRLASFSIETDQHVLVMFEDGTSRRLKRQELRGQLHPDDYARLSKAFRLRQSFWRRNLPGSLALLTAGTAATALLVGTDRPLFHAVAPHSRTTSRPINTVTADKVIPLPSPTPSPTPDPSPRAPQAKPAVSARPGHSSQAPGLLRRLSRFVEQVLQ